ncbi:uncharacterized protein BDW47DRAFT_124779 [Aspergillus candidus]|uniref:Sex determining protein n=1 Tax=Aspergillus candidus TaxID=41067 RepID=A0A2I2FEU0_ASPCN|nr:hypothetical protein BDW47DRAFT_124779 [Aspergillus candidus]PLB39153.1 hypothetical protein BDW47DRAFT_124779 [Aspergillus candidus]
MYPWNTTLPPPPSATGRLQFPASTSTSSPAHTSHQMSSMQWRPSMTSRSSTQGPLAGLHMNQGSATGSSPTPGSTASPFRPMSLSRPRSNHEMPPVSVVIESRAQPRIDGLDSSDSERSVDGIGTRGATTSGLARTGDNREGNKNRRDQTDRDAPDDDAVMIVDEGPNESGMGRAESSSTAATNTNTNNTTNNNNTHGHPNSNRRHGKRLTTLEEVSLFDICNRHAADFGHRSSLCKWWMTVTEEFTRDQGHPYSWHSVRRKVEIVTKQRQKFLEESRQQREPPVDSANPRWRVAVDAWIPTWQRWEEAEARRIEKRDMRRPRKRKYWEASSPWDVISTMSCDGGWKAPPAPAPVPSLPASGSGESPSSTAPAAAAAAAPPPPPAGDVSGSRSQQDGFTSTSTSTSTPVPAPISTPTAVRLPPGFDTMFQGNSPATPIHHTPTAQAPSMDAGVMSAMLETLGKLNKHLDAAASTTPTEVPRAPQLPVPLQLPPSSASSAASISSAPSSERENLSPRPSIQDNNHSNANTNTNKTNSPGNLSTAAITQLKNELRLEMRDEIHRELEKDRAALEEKLDAVQRTQDMILEMLRQEPA